MDPNGFAVRPPRGGDAPAEIGECLLGNVDVEGADGGVAREVLACILGRSARRCRKQTEGAQGGRADKKAASVEG
jgi:hypothetical protein